MSSSSPSPRQQLNLLSPTELKAKRDELEARIAYVESREKVLKKLEHNISVLESTYGLRKKQLDTLNKEVEQQQHIIKDYPSKLHQLEVNHKEVLSDYKRKERLAAEQIDTALGTLQDIRAQIAEAEKSFKERRQYLKDQEELINTTIEEGNITIQSITYEIKGLEEAKGDVNRKIMTLNRDKSRVIDELSNFQDALDELQTEYSEKSARYERSLSDMNVDIANAKRELERVTAEVVGKLRSLKEKEESLIAKQAALKREREQLDLQRRRQDSRENLYGV